MIQKIPTKGISYTLPSFLIIFVYCIFGLENSAHGQKADSLFLSDDLINIELRADFDAIQKDRWKEDTVETGGEPEYFEAMIVYGDHDNKIEVPVNIKARGKFRRNPEHCKFPPLMLNFKKKEAKNTLFDHQDKPKLVTPCQGDPEVIKEYIVYKMLNLITDYSYKVRLANILYYNTSKNKKLMERLSFFIEEDDRVAKRNDAKIVKKHHFPFDLDPDEEAKVSMFQFIIGNSDWYYTSRQNMDIMHPNDTTLLPMPVPYDFDFSDFVHAAYTKPPGVPDEMLAKRRIYKGMCLSDEKLNEVIEYYNTMRPQFEEIINGNEFLPTRSKKECLKYLDESYTIINTPKLVKTEIFGTCKTREDYIPKEFKMKK